MAKVSTQDLAKAVADHHGLSQREAEAFVSTLFDILNDGLHREKIVKVKGLGTFKVIDVRERESVNVNTGERVVIESHGKITFTPDNVMRDLVNKPFAQFETVVLNDGVDLNEMSKVQVEGESTADNPIDDVEDENMSELSTAEESFAEGGVEDDAKDSDELESSVESDDTDDVSETKDEEPQEASMPVAQDTEDDNASQDGDIPNMDEPEESAVVVEDNAVVAVDEQQEGRSSDNDDNVIPVQDVPDAAVDAENEVGNNNVVDAKKTYNPLIFIVPSLLLAVATLFIGRYWGRNSVEPVVKYKVVHVVDKQAAAKAKVDTLQRNDTVQATEKVETTSEKSEVDVKEGRQDQPQSEPAVVENESLDLSNARSMVRTGAYRITGTANTITVKRGETMKKISKFYLGDGMECYIQVHNGVTEVKEGMKLKIPKLELKRKKK